MTEMVHDTLANARTPRATGSGAARGVEHALESRSQPMPSVRPLLHPTERSRFALALLASLFALGLPIVLLLAAANPTAALALVLFLAFTVAMVWLGVQLRRARLLGVSVRVDADTFPELNEMIEEVREILHYRRPIDFYVTESAKPGVTMTSLLGTRIVLIEGGLVADLMKPGKRAQLMFLLGRSIGALRAKHTRLDLTIQLLQAADVLKYVTPFILPYYRATAYSGDQIGLMCCDDLSAGLEATRRLLVGGEMATQLAPGAVLPQSMLVKRRVFPRFVQLLGREPHTTNRYANLLCFGRYHDPALWEAMRDGMSERELNCLEALWRSSPYRSRVESGATRPARQP